MPTFKKLIILLFLSLITFSCGKTETSVAPEIPEDNVTPVITEVVELAPVETPEYKQAMITFIAGDVFVLEEGDWIYAEIGDFLEADDSIQVESDSYCEIQFGDRAVVRVEADTELALSSVFMKPGETKIGIDLAIGSVLVKVQKLTGGGKLNVKTQSAVCGVRGTEFSVKSEPGVETVLAVKEGAVAILPPELDIEELIKKAGDNGEVVAAILESIEASASVVVADEEISLTEKSFEEIEESVQVITEIVEAIFAAEENEVVISEVIFETLTEAAELVTEIVEAEEIPVKELSVENKVSLKNIEEMRMISLPAAKAQVKDGVEKDTESETAAPVIYLRKFSLKVIPANAEILLNSQIVGKGSFAGIFEEGDILNFNFISENFESQKMSFTMSEETSKQYSISLTKSKSESDKKQDTESESSAADEEEKVIEIKEDGKQQEAIAAEVSIEKNVVIYSPPVEKMIEVNIMILPSDSSLIVNGERIRSGKFTGNLPPGTKLRIEGKRNGFADKSMVISVGDAGTGRLVLNLEPQPVESVLSVSNTKLVGSITTGANMVFTSDSQGIISAVNSDGEKVWSVKTGNTSVENSYPVFSGNRIYFSGSREMVIINALNGKLIERQNLDKDSAHIFGRRIVPMGAQSLVPSNEEIRIINRDNGNLIGRINLPGNGSRMTPAVWNDKILSVDQEGTLSVLNSRSGVVEKEITSTGIQPIALSVTVKNDIAVFSGRKGNVVCVDLKAEKVLWEKQLSNSENRVQVYSDIVCSNTGAYIYAKGLIYGLDMDSGEDLFGVVRNVSSPPALIDNSLVFGLANSTLVFMDPSNGNIRESVNLEEPVSTRPAKLGDKIAVGTSKGKVIIINPEGIR